MQEYPASLEAQQRYSSYRAIIVAMYRKTLLCLFLCGVSHHYRAICCKMGYRTDVPGETKYEGGVSRYCTILGEC